MKLLLAVLAAIALGIGSFAASFAGSAPRPRALVPADLQALSAIDGHLRGKLHRLAQR